MTAQLYTPKVYLFAFHLFKTPDADANSSAKDPDLLWDKCQEIFSKFHIKSPLKLHPPQPEDCRFDLLDGDNSDDIVQKIKTEIPYQGDEIKLEGFAYPLQLYDSYGLGLNLGYPDPQPQNSHKLQVVDTSLLEVLNPDSCFLPDTVQSYFGQTVIITAWLGEEQKHKDDKFLEDLADECIREFVHEPGKRPELYQKGQLFGSPIFEYGLISDRENYRHILVWLYSDFTTDANFQKCYQLLLDLLFYRNKIIKEFWNSRDTYRQAYQEYEQIQKLIRKTFADLPQTDTLSEDDLKYLKVKLKEMAQSTVEYSDLLRDLESRRNSIAIHTDNYKNRLRSIRNKLARLAPEEEIDLSFLASFAQENCRIFQEQIQGDLGYFVPGANLLEKAIAAIRGIVEIDQAERDRQREDREKKREEDEEKKQEAKELKEKEKEHRLERTVQVLGVGIGVGGLIASSCGQIDKPFALPWSPNATNTPHPVVSTLFLSLLFAFIFGGITWWVTRPK